MLWEPGGYRVGMALAINDGLCGDGPCGPRVLVGIKTRTRARSHFLDWLRNIMSIPRS